jgi:hypothetical protein
VDGIPDATADEHAGDFTDDACEADPEWHASTLNSSAAATTVVRNRAIAFIMLVAAQPR